MNTSPPTDPPTDTAETRQQLIRLLERVRSRHTLMATLGGGANWLSGLVAVAVVLIGIESVAYLAPAKKTVTLLMLGLLGAVAAFVWLYRPLRRPMSLEAVARLVESAHDGLHQHLTNAVQLWDLRDAPGTSRALVDAAIRQAYETTGSLDFAAAVDTGPAKASGRRFALVCVVGLIALQLYPGHGIDALARLTDPTGRYVRPLETRLAVTPGDTVLIAGDSLHLVAEASGVVPLDALLQTREEGSANWTSIDVPVRENRAEHRLSSVRKSFTYRWRAHDATSPAHVVIARPRPVVLSLTTRYRYPAYTRLPERVDREGGDVAALVGTAVTLQARANRPLSDAWLAFENGTRVPGTVDGDTLTATFNVERPARFTIRLRDTVGVENADPITYRVLTLEDAPPEIVVLRPGGDSELGEQMLVPLMFETTDDFGVSRVEIAYRVNQDGDAQTHPVTLESPGAPEQTQGVIWDLSGANLLPGDQVIYRLRAYDINTLTGPGVGETPEFIVRFPSLQEIHEAATRSQDDTVAQLEEVAEQSRQLQEKLENVAREVTKNEEATWEDRAEIREALAQQEALQEQIDEGVRALDEARQRMEQSGLLTPETVEKIQQVRSLMESLNTPELDRLTQDLQGAAEEIDPEMIQEAIDRLTSEQEAFQENLDRTIALLKRVRDEQMLDALSARLRDLATYQRDIERALKDGKAPETMAERQNVQTRESDHFQKALDEAAQSIDAPDNRLAELTESFEKASIPDRSDQTRRDMRAGRKDRSQTGASDLADDLDKMAGALEDIQDAYRQQQKDELLAQLSGLFRDALDLSRSQERTAERASETDRPADPEQLARKQTRDLNAAARLEQRMTDASRKSFLVPPQAGNGLRNAMEQMQKSMGQLQRGQQNQAGKNAREAMAGLNGAAMAMRDAMAAIRAAGSATGLDEMLQQLAAASDRQGDLNQQTEGMMGQPQPSGRPGSQPGGGLPQLSAEQEAIRQMLNDIREKFGAQEGSALGDLGQVSQDMEEVARRLGRNQLDAPTVERQRRILSRMLDAQRSIRQRGYSNDREARTGADVAYRGPGTLPSDLGESGNPLRALLRDALRQNYPDEYQTLIRRYFDRLIEDAGVAPSQP